MRATRRRNDLQLNQTTPTDNLSLPPVSIICHLSSFTFSTLVKSTYSPATLLLVQSSPRFFYERNSLWLRRPIRDTEVLTRYPGAPLRPCYSPNTPRECARPRTMVLLSDSSSAISSLSSDESEEVENDYDDANTIDEPVLPPSKRQKLGDGSRASSSLHIDPEPEPDPEPEHNLDDGDISSDTSGDVPNSPINAKLDEDEFQEQVTVCAWDGCRAGDLGNMDRLVEHIHNDHIESRQKKYTCEWIGCSRKSLSHASGYALKAHMRSHTREKPFYCYLPGKAI